MKKSDLKKYKLLDKPGVYFFKKGDEVLYIGKATSLRDRVKSYFSPDLIVARGPMILDMVTSANKLEWQETDSVLEALILEAELIKKHQPFYNTKEKSDKSWNYVCITGESIPRVLIVRGRNLKSTPWRRCTTFGPYTNSSQLKIAMKIIRRIFPYLDGESLKKNNQEFYKQINLVPTLQGGEGLKAYKKNIANLKLFFQGKKKKILNNLQKEMMQLAKRREFEKASGIKKQIFALNHINDVALIKEENFEHSVGQKFSGEQNEASVRRRKLLPDKMRTEAYDISHLAGKNIVGVMVVLEDGEIAKSEYRKFIIRSQVGSNDTGALSEVLSRRLGHNEWQLPSLIVVDGGKAQVNTISKIIKIHKLKIPIVGVVKDEHHKAKAILGDEKIIQKYKNQILLANAESHRFAIKFHREKSKIKLI